MVEQMVCKRNKAHCSPIRRRFLKTTVAALLLFSTQAFAQQASCSTRTITSVSIASNPSKQAKGFAAILAENKSAPSNALRSSIAPLPWQLSSQCCSTSSVAQRLLHRHLGHCSRCQNDPPSRCPRLLPLAATAQLLLAPPRRVAEPHSWRGESRCSG